MQLSLFGLALIFYFGFHSFLAHQNIKKYLIKNWISKRYYRLGYNFIAIVLLVLLLIYYQSISASSLFENNWIKTVGFCICLLGMVLLFLALKQYNLAEFSGIQQFKNELSPSPIQLHTSGLNSYVRHPLYLSMLLLIWGYFLFQPTDLFLLTTIIATIYIYVGTLLEEEKLILEFGEQYIKYQQNVSMLFPLRKFL